MHNNYYFLKQLSKRIADKLKVKRWALGWENYQKLDKIAQRSMRLGCCFSQSKDELILGFYSENEDFYMRAVLEASLACLAFTDGFARAKRNSVDLFSDLVGLKVIGTIQHLNERSFSLEFEKDYILLFKMHGRRANIVLFQKSEFVVSFHKKMENDREINPEELDRSIEQSFENFKVQEGNYKKLFPTFSKDFQSYFNKKNYQEAKLEQKWQIIQDAISDLENPTFYILKKDNEVKLSLFEPESEAEVLAQSRDPLQASQDFHHSFSRTFYLNQEKKQALKTLQRKSKQARNYIDKNTERFIKIEDSFRNEETAHIIMANLHQIQQGQTAIELFDFYRNESRTVKLKKDLSPQRNAETYYRKAKNEKIELNTLQKNIARKEKELQTLEEQIKQIEAFDDLKSLRKYLKNNTLSQSKSSSSKPQDTLFKKFYYQGFDIWVGKNAKNNDTLTQRYAYKEDLWLHAKDVSGSHVLVKHQANKPFPKEVIEKAASLAAYYSKRSKESLCPVIVTPKKFVRKTKDLAPGQVIVEKEEVLMVIPEKF